MSVKVLRLKLWTDCKLNNLYLLNLQRPHLQKDGFEANG